MHSLQWLCSVKVSREPGSGKPGCKSNPELGNPEVRNPEIRNPDVNSVVTNPVAPPTLILRTWALGDYLIKLL